MSIKLFVNEEPIILIPDCFSFTVAIICRVDFLIYMTEKNFDWIRTLKENQKTHTIDIDFFERRYTINNASVEENYSFRHDTIDISFTANRDDYGN